MLPKHRPRESHRSRLVHLGCEVMEDRVLLSAALPDYHFTAPALVAGTTQHNAPSSIGAFTKAPGGTTQRIVSNASMNAILPAAPSFTATPVSAMQINLAWTPVSGANGYLVDEWINGAWEQIGNLGSSSTGAAVTGLRPNTTYYFDVAAYNAAGTIRANYQSITMPLPTAPAVAHPTSPGTYQVVNGTLFGPNGPQYSDVKQGGYLGDCWLVASLAEAAYRDPALIRNMFTYLGQYNENGATVQLYDVRLYTAGGPPREILVDNEFAMYAGSEYGATVLNGVLWVALAEKAYVQAAAAGYVVNSYTDTFAQVPDSYQDVVGGYPYWALNALTGNASTEYYSVNNGSINAEMAVNGGLVVLVTGTPSSSLVVPDHCYAVLADNPGATWQFSLYNPWNLGSIYDWNGRDVYGSVFYCNQAFLDQNFDGFGFAVA